jgi:ATP-binding cassette, subfamily C (CFTR/MRP), member 1
VPQEPVLFNGTIRFNLDPFGKASDDFIIQLLKDADLWEVIQELSTEKRRKSHNRRTQIRKRYRLAAKKFSYDRFFKDPSDLYWLERHKNPEYSDKDLYLQIDDNGSDFSAGQKQLMCIIRAIIQKSKIAILDEATSSIDVVTEKKIQELITLHFKEATMLTIAHRLNTIKNSDKILLMSYGQVEEFDTPENLLANPDSMYSQLVSQIKQAEQE